MNPRANPVPRALAMQVPGDFTGPRVVTFLPENLPDQLRAIIRSSGLQPGAVQGGRLIEELSVPSRYLLELTVSLSTLEGDTLLAELVPDRMESPGSPRWEVGSHEGEVF